MAHDTSGTADGSRRWRPAVEGLEARRLLTASSSSAAAQYRLTAEHKDHQYVSALQRIELKSQATPAQYLAVRDDAKAIAAAAASTTLPPAIAAHKAVAVSLQLDRSVLDGWMGDSGWSQVQSNLEANLDGLNVPQPLIEQTVADMKAFARSASVTLDEKTKLESAADSLQNAENTLVRYQVTGVHFPTPELYFTQHLRGFARGGAVQRRADEARQSTDIRALPNASPARTATVRRDLQLLEQVGGRVSTAVTQQIDNALLTAMTPGPPTDQGVAQARADIQTALGAEATPRNLAAVDRVLADAPTFFQAAGASADHVRTLLNDVQAIIADGGGSSLNPFKIQIVRPALPH